MVLFQADKNKEPIQMSIQEMDGGASAQQKGDAAQMRTYINEGIKGKMNACLFKDLSFIVHSGDRNPHLSAFNRFADPTNEYDPSAEPRLEAAKQNIRQVRALAKRGIILPITYNCPTPNPNDLTNYMVGSGEYMEELSGGKMASKSIKQFLDASYAKKGKAPQNIDGYVRDNSLSGERVSVYFDPATRKAVVIHRGSQGIHDWGNNLKMALGFNMSNTQRFKHSKEIQKKAESKYGAKNITTLGHSLGGKIASDVGEDSNEIITLNKATGIGRDAYKKEFGQKENETNVRTTLDPVSAKGALDADFTIPSKSLNFFTEHGTGVLDRVNTEIGRGRADLTPSPSVPTFQRKPYEKLTKKQLKQIIKSLPKVRDGFQLTGAGKTTLVDYLEKRCGK
jgi:hypothetical protein